MSLLPFHFGKRKLEFLEGRIFNQFVKLRFGQGQNFRRDEGEGFSSFDIQFLALADNA